MKRSLLVIFMTVLAYTAKSQVAFCTPGAEWRYLFYNGFTPGVRGNMFYARDSTMGTVTVKVLNYMSFFKESGGSQCHNVLIKQSGDTIFMKNCNTLNNWQILYNFAANAGQSWNTTIHDDSNYGSHYTITYTITVTSVSTVTINNMNLKKLQVSYCYKLPGNQNVTCNNADIIERIGCTTYLFNYYAEFYPIDHASLGEFYVIRIIYWEPQLIRKRDVSMMSAFVEIRLLEVL